MNKLNQPCVILDRDGVINIDSQYVSSVSQWHPIPGSIESIAALTKAGYQLFVITNQSGIGRGYYSEADLQKIHQHMLSVIEQAGGEIAGVYFCPHAPEEHCQCRKPAPGMFLQLAEEHQVDLTQALFVGDKLSDLQAGDAVGAKSILVKTGYGELTLQHLPADHRYPVYSNLQALVQSLLA